MDHDPFDLRGQERTKKEKSERDKHAQQVDAEDIKWLMGSKRGRRIVWRLLGRTGVFRSSFTGNSETFFREGERNVGLFLLAQINGNCPETYNLMVQEQKDDGKRQSSDTGTN